MWTIYHNPNCSKSNAALSLLLSKGIQPKVVSYLETPPDKVTLLALLKMLSFDIEAMVRKKEEGFIPYATVWKTYSLEEKIEFLEQHISLLERPIVVHDNRAIIGRPTVEAILPLFDEEKE